MPDPRSYPRTDLGWRRRDAEDDRTAAMVVELLEALARRSGTTPAPEPCVVFSPEYDAVVAGQQPLPFEVRGTSSDPRAGAPLRFYRPKWR